MVINIKDFVLNLIDNQDAQEIIIEHQNKNECIQNFASFCEYLLENGYTTPQEIRKASKDFLFDKIKYPTTISSKIINTLNCAQDKITEIQINNNQKVSLYFDKLISPAKKKIESILKNNDGLSLNFQNPTQKEIKDSILLFACLISEGHVAWPHFKNHLKQKFKKGIINLYNNPPQNSKDTLKAFETLLLQTIPDNHTFILNNNNDRVITSEEVENIKDSTIIEKYPQPSVGKNTFFTLENNPNVKTLMKQEANNQGIAIFEQDILNNKKIGIISLSKCPQPTDKNFDIDAFIAEFDKNLQNWDGVVFDVRGNEGGNSKIINEISKRLYGKTPEQFKGANLRLTDTARLIQNIKFQNHPYIQHIHANKQNNNPDSYHYEPEIPFVPYDPERGFNKNIYVLTDRKTSSSAEFVCALEKHPKIKFLGEHSCGCGQYGDTTGVPLPCGGMLVTGVFNYTLHPNIPEGYGYTPTHPTKKGDDAFQHCLSMIMDGDLSRQPNSLSFKDNNSR